MLLPRAPHRQGEPLQVDISYFLEFVRFTRKVSYQTIMLRQAILFHYINSVGLIFTLLSLYLPIYSSKHTLIDKACAVVPEFKNRIPSFDKKLHMALSP